MGEEEDEEEGEEEERKRCGRGETVPPAPLQMHQGAVVGEDVLFHICSVFKLDYIEYEDIAREAVQHLSALPPCCPHALFPTPLNLPRIYKTAITRYSQTTKKIVSLLCGGAPWRRLQCWHAVIKARIAVADAKHGTTVSIFSYNCLTETPPTRQHRPQHRPRSQVPNFSRFVMMATLRRSGGAAIEASIVLLVLLCLSSTRAFVPGLPRQSISAWPSPSFKMQPSLQQQQVREPCVMEAERVRGAVGGLKGHHNDVARVLTSSTIDSSTDPRPPPTYSTTALSQYNRLHATQRGGRRR